MSEFDLRTIRYTSAPGTVDSMRCEVCGAVCQVRRDVETYSGMIAAMAKKTSRLDVFTCPHQETDWHNLAVRLVDAIDETPSRRLAALMHLDLEDVLIGSGVEGVSVPERRDE